MQPLVLEKAATLGGGTVHSYGLIWVGQNHLAQAARHSDSRDEVFAYMRFLGGGNVDESRLSAFVEHAPEALKLFERCGVRFRVVRSVTDHYYDKAPGSHAIGRTLEADLISGFDLGEMRERVSVPQDVPCFVTAEEQIAWGGINSISRWDADIVGDRKRQDIRGKGLGLICHFLKALDARIVNRRRPRSRRRDRHRRRSRPRPRPQVYQSCLSSGSIRSGRGWSRASASPAAMRRA